MGISEMTLMFTCAGDGPPSGPPRRCRRAGAARCLVDRRRRAASPPKRTSRTRCRRRGRARCRSPGPRSREIRAEVEAQLVHEGLGRAVDVPAGIRKLRRRSSPGSPRGRGFARPSPARGPGDIKQAVHVGLDHLSQPSRSPAWAGSSPTASPALFTSTSISRTAAGSWRWPAPPRRHRGHRASPGAASRQLVAQGLEAILAAAGGDDRSRPRARSAG